MIETMGMRRLPPRTKTLLRAITAGVAVLVVAMGARMWMVVGKAKRASAPSPVSLAEPSAKRTFDSLGAIPLSAPSVAQRSADGRAGEGGGPPPPPPLDTSGLDLKGVFVNMFDKRKSIAIVSSQGSRDLILKRGDSARAGVMVDEIFADHVVFRGVSGDTRSMLLTKFIKDNVVIGGQAPVVESLADIENPMGSPVFDPTASAPGMAGDVIGDGGASPGPVKFMPSPQMPVTASGGSHMAAPMVGGSEAAKSVSSDMNAAGRIPGGGQ